MNSMTTILPSSPPNSYGNKKSNPPFSPTPNMPQDRFSLEKKVFSV
jgi:hypothetical protein